jgi:hypothetical protein
MARGKAKIQLQVTAWWMSGDEECLHCGQLYAYEIEFRCPVCDNPSCPHCRMQHAAGHNVCPACVDAVEEPDHG